MKVLWATKLSVVVLGEFSYNILSIMIKIERRKERLDYCNWIVTGVCTIFIAFKHNTTVIYLKERHNK